MKNLLILFFAFCGIDSFGQVCDTINGERINCRDTYGLKQGHWEITKKKVLVSSHYGLGSKEGCKYYEKAEYYLLQKGTFKNDNKIGNWEYYSGNKSNILESKINYFEDGSVTEENLSENYKIYIGQDSIIVKGQIFHPLDTLKIKCQFQTCSIEMTNGKVILNFGFDNFDKLKFEILRLNLGYYDKEIRTQANNGYKSCLFGR